MRRGGCCLKVILSNLFHLQNLHVPQCASAAPVCVLCANLLRCCCPKNMTLARPRCNATPSKSFVFQISHFTLHVASLSFSTLHTSRFRLHLNSSHLSSSRVILMQPSQCELQPRVAEHPRGTNHTSERTALNCRAHELPFTAGCSHFTRKNAMFRALASSPTQVPRNIHAAITMRFATARCRTTQEPITRQNKRPATAARTSCPSPPAAVTLPGKTQCFVLWPPPQHKSHATVMQPLQCDLQPHVAEHPSNQAHVRTNGPQPPHTRAALHRRLQPLCPKKHNVSCSGFLRNTSPMQHSCSHYNAFCSTNVSLWMYCYVMYSVMYCYVLYCDV